MCQQLRHLTVDRRISLKLAYSPYLDRSALRGRSAVQQMAEDFLIFAANAGSISQDDLEILGWSPLQIALHGAQARRHANARAARSRERVRAANE